MIRSTVLILSACIWLYNYSAIQIPYVKANQESAEAKAFIEQEVQPTHEKLIIEYEVGNLAWTILDYYTPGLNHSTILDQERLYSPDFWNNQETATWLFSSFPLTEENTSVLIQYYDYTAHGQHCLGDNRFYIYHCVRHIPPVY